MGRFVDLTGQRFGRWTVLYRGKDVYENGHPRVRWHCRCACGVERDVAPLALKNGASKSCGCLHRERVREGGHKNRKHGMKHTRIYGIWSNMHSRCDCQTNERYRDYDGRGIKVCDEWSGKNGFINFYSWAIENGYRDNLTIDRVDNDGCYEPANCRWVDCVEQSNNRRSNRFLTVDGDTKTIAQWLKMLDVKSSHLYEYDEKRQVEYVKKRLEKTDKD